MTPREEFLELTQKLLVRLGCMDASLMQYLIPELNILIWNYHTMGGMKNSVAVAHLIALIDQADSGEKKKILFLLGYKSRDKQTYPFCMRPTENYEAAIGVLRTVEEMLDV